MTPLIAGTLVGAGSSLLSKGLDRIFGRSGQETDQPLSSSPFALPGQNLPGAGTNSPSTDPAQLFSQIDTNKDGALSKDEVTSFVRQQQLAMQAALLDLQAHSQASTQGRAHHHNGQAKGHTGGPQAADQLMNRMDADNDGAVSQDEFSSFLAAMSKQLSASAGATAGAGSPTSASSVSAPMSGATA